MTCIKQHCGLYGVNRKDIREVILHVIVIVPGIWPFNDVATSV